MFLARMLTPHSLPEIGRRFGGRDHSTVLHTVRKIEALSQTDTTLCEEIAAMAANLSPDLDDVRFLGTAEGREGRANRVGDETR